MTPLTRLRLPGEPEAWRAAGFAVGADGRFTAGGVAIELDGADGRWAWDGPDVLGFARIAPGAGTGAEHHAPHPNTVVGVDHVVVFDRDPVAVVAGLDVLKILRQEDRTYAYVKLGTALLEVVAAPGATPGPWGVTFVAADPGHAAPPRPAVQRGRSIATFPREAGLGLAVALITPRPGTLT